MVRQVLIVSELHDAHAHAVRAALIGLGAALVCICTLAPAYADEADADALCEVARYHQQVQATARGSMRTALAMLLSTGEQSVTPTLEADAVDSLGAWRNLLRTADVAATPCEQVLLQRAGVDQFLRVTLAQAQWDWETVRALDALNSEALETILEMSGYEPYRSAPARLAILTIAVHSPDASLQARVADSLRSIALESDTPEIRIAWGRLEDRARVLAGEPQIYGTQRWIDGDCTRLFDLDDPERVAQRRSELGLPAMREGRLCED